MILMIPILMKMIMIVIMVMVMDIIVTLFGIIIVTIGHSHRCDRHDDDVEGDDVKFYDENQTSFIPRSVLLLRQLFKIHCYMIYGTRKLYKLQIIVIAILDDADEA